MARTGSRPGRRSSFPVRAPRRLGVPLVRRDSEMTSTLDSAPRWEQVPGSPIGDLRDRGRVRRRDPHSPQRVYSTARFPDPARALDRPLQRERDHAALQCAMTVDRIHQHRRRLPVDRPDESVDQPVAKRLLHQKGTSAIATTNMENRTFSCPVPGEKHRPPGATLVVVTSRIRHPEG
jgi:hypothetical protein